MSPRSITLLGTGYTGHALLRLLEARGAVVSSTRRPSLLRLPPDHRGLLFALEDPSTWNNLPESEATVWIFPAQPVDFVRRFFAETATRLGRLVAVGTTSAYLQRREDEIVTEESGLDERQERVQGENYLMAQGAIVLRSAGIYGPALGALTQRNPLDWLRAGRIASGDAWVNLVHVADLARAIVSALDSECSADHFIVSDGMPRRWREIASWAVAGGYLGEVQFGSGGPQRPSRRLSNRKLLTTLAPEFRHADLYGELSELERQKG